jgi:hypothetical protein
MTQICLARIDAGGDLGVPASTLRSTRFLLSGTQRAVEQGRLGYARISASAP